VTPRKARHGRNLIEHVSALMFPTPAAGDSKKGMDSTYARGNPSLGKAVMFPTPTLTYSRENWSAEDLAAKQAEVKAATLAKGKHQTGNGFGLNLAQAARLYPTPRTTGLNGGPGGREMIRKLLADGSITREEAIAMAETVHVSMSIADDIPSVSTPTSATPSIASLLGIPETPLPRTPITTILPTPASRDYRSPNSKPYAERGGGKKGEQLPNAVGGSLNPTWVELLMGFRPGWTAIMATFSRKRGAKS
jgi:hypothetical protein